MFELLMVYAAPTPAVTVHNTSTPPTPRSSHASQSQSGSISSSPPLTSSDSPNRVNTVWTGNVLHTFARNKGLFLVAASGFFFSSVNLAVKKVNSADPPVPALEVSSPHSYSTVIIKY